MTKRVYIETYGCQMNVADTELMFGVLGGAGFARVDTPEQADVMLVNTCAVRDNAEQRVVGAAWANCCGTSGPATFSASWAAWRSASPGAARRRRPRGSRRRSRCVPEPRRARRAGGGRAGARYRVPSWEHYEDVPPVRVPGPTQFVTVQRGCDYKCTFCIVPYTRGPERSRRLEDVVQEVRQLVEQGTSEVTLLGQTVNSWTDGTHEFGQLLRAVGAVDGIRRLRFTSPYPTDFTPQVIAAMAETPAVCEHVHLPVQAGSNSELRRMLRRYTREQYLAVVAELRAAMPAITLSTDIIVGFPGETDEEFAQTLSLVTEADFDEA